MRRRAQRGVALLVVLVLVALLTALVVELVYLGGAQRMSAERTLEDLQVAYALRAGYYRARLYLEADAETAADVETLHEDWAHPIRFQVGAAHVVVEIADGERSIHVGKLIRPDGGRCQRVVAILTNLGYLLGLDATVPERLADYMDEDSWGSFEQGAADRLLLQPEEVLRIPGVAAEVWLGRGENGAATPGYLRHLTVWPRVPAQTCPEGGAPGPVDMKVNVNTAPREVVAVLFDPPSTSYADAMVSWREGTAPTGERRAFRSIADVAEALGSMQAAQAIQDVVVFKSRFFMVRVRARSGGLEEGHVFVVERVSGGQHELRAHYRMPDFVYAQAPEP